MVYFPTFTIKNQPNVGKYTSPMDPTGERNCFKPFILTPFRNRALEFYMFRGVRNDMFNPLLRLLSIGTAFQTVEWILFPDPIDQQ